MKEGVVKRFEAGGNIGLTSTVPLGAGVSSSAALEVASLCALTAAYRVQMDGLRLAVLAQIVENKVVGAPCGIMDQVTSALGEEGKLLALKCQPHDILKNVQMPPGFKVIGINSHVKHSVGGSKYTDARVGAFMGHKIVFNHLRSRGINHDPYNGYLANITPQEYLSKFRRTLPGSISGREFLDRYGPTMDAVTAVDPDKRYMVRSRAEHPIYENARVGRFIELMEMAGKENPAPCMIEAGKLMYGSHWSYGKKCGLGSPETDLLVKLVRRAGPESGLYGAKITGGGSGGTVAVLAAQEADSVIEEIACEYRRRTGIKPDVFAGTSPGAFQHGYDVCQM
jgi:L-arabinokinase